MNVAIITVVGAYIRWQAHRSAYPIQVTRRGLILVESISSIDSNPLFMSRASSTMIS